MIIDSIHQLIGNTPMMKFSGFGPSKTVNIYAKLEYLNPGGSIKDRLGSYILSQAEKEGKLDPDTVMIEATAGNTGIGLALAAIEKKYKLILVVPGKFSKEKKVIMQALGAEIVETPTTLGLQGAFDEVHRLSKLYPKVFLPQQFSNLHNPEVYEQSLGSEIYHELEGNLQAFVTGAGTGGTFTGVTRFLKSKNTAIKGILADPEGSIIGGGSCHGYKIEGIGNDFIPKTMDRTLLDGVIKVTDQQAFSTTRFLAKEHGLLVGSSSGAAFYAAMKLAEDMESGNIVTLFADRGDRYITQGLYEHQTSK